MEHDWQFPILMLVMVEKEAYHHIPYLCTGQSSLQCEGNPQRNANFSAYKTVNLENFRTTFLNLR